METKRSSFLLIEAPVVSILSPRFDSNKVPVLVYLENKRSCTFREKFPSAFCK